MNISLNNNYQSVFLNKLSRELDESSSQNLSNVIDFFSENSEQNYDDIEPPTFDIYDLAGKETKAALSAGRPLFDLYDLAGEIAKELLSVGNPLSKRISLVAH